MYNKRNILIGAGLVMTSMLQPLAAQDITCEDGERLTRVSGKIFNNAVQPGTTLGTAHVKLGKKKMKCGILGQGAAGDNGSINFVHTFVCDDKVEFPLTGDTIHSQLTLNTTGFANVQSCEGFPPGSTYGTFEETSVPVPGTGRGVFADVERGEIQIKGTINCLFAIDMKFSGAVCLKTSP